MDRKISITVYPSEKQSNILLIDDVMKQVLVFFKLLSSDEKHKELRWELVSIKMESPPVFTAKPISSDPQIDIYALSEQVIDNFDKSMDVLYTGHLPKEWSGNDYRKVVSDFISGVKNGIGKIEIDYHDDYGHVVFDKSIAEHVSDRLKKNDDFYDFLRSGRKRSEVGSIDGRIVAVGEYNKEPAIQIYYRLKNAYIWCLVPVDIRNKIQLSFSDIWESRRIKVSGELRYSDAGKLTRIIANKIDLYESEKVGIDDLYDPDYTGGLSSVEYINKIRGH